MKIAINTRDLTVDQYDQLMAGGFAETVTRWEDQILVNMIWDQQIKKFADLGIMGWVVIAGTEREQDIATNQIELPDEQRIAINQGPVLFTPNVIRAPGDIR